MLKIVFLSLSHVVSWIRCGTWLYRFLILAAFLTLLMYLQVESKDHMKAKRRSDEEFLERLEQVQLAEEYVQ